MFSLRFHIILFFSLFFCLITNARQRTEYIDFCGERAPSEYSFVKSRIEKNLELYRNNPKRLESLKAKANFYFPYIEAKLKENEIPLDFKYLPIVESDLKRNAISIAGAGGFWQFMPSTAKQLGLSVQDIKDERASMVKSTLAACKHIRYLYGQLKNWTLVAAAYNVGAGALTKSITRQKISNYYFLRLNEETGNYVYRILAIKMLFSENRENQAPIEIQKKKVGFNSGKFKQEPDSLKKD